MSNHVRHPYHLVDESPWPLVSANAAFLLTVNLLQWFQDKTCLPLLLALVVLGLTMNQWWRDISREASYQGLHSVVVESGLRWGMVLFIISEMFFFLSFFWAFFHSSLAPSFEIGGVWPPVGILALNPFEVPLLNTLVLLSSGVTVTWAHHAVMAGDHTNASQGLLITIVLGLYFSILQAAEYAEASFTMSDCCYGSSFFLATGFHGIHVLVGTSFLAVCFLRLILTHFSSVHHFGFEAAAWYWHFVDVVWLFLYVFVYWWGAA